MDRTITPKYIATALLVLVCLSTQAQLTPAGGVSLDQNQVVVSPDPFQETFRVSFNELNVRGTVTVAAIHLETREKFAFRNVNIREGITIDATAFPVGAYSIVIYRTSDGANVAQTRAIRTGSDPGLLTNTSERSEGDPKSVDADKRPFHVYPNPFNDRVNVRFNKEKFNVMVKLELRTINTGQVVATALVDPRSIGAIPTADIPNGTYLLDVRNAVTNELYGSVQMRK